MWLICIVCSQCDTKYNLSYLILSYLTMWHFKLTSSNGNIFSVTGPCEENPSLTGGFPSQRPVTRSFDVSFDLRLNMRLYKQSKRRWFETPSRPLWHHCNVWYTSNGFIVFQETKTCISLNWHMVSVRFFGFCSISYKCIQLSLRTQGKRIYEN